jgi:hypothetical protein
MFGISGAGLYYYQAGDLNQAIGASRQEENGALLRSAELRERLAMLLLLLEHVPGLPRPSPGIPENNSQFFQLAEGP